MISTRSLSLLLFLAFVFAVGAFAQPSPRICYSDRECDEGYHCKYEGYCMPDNPGSCPGDCWCPGGGGPGCTPPIGQLVSKVTGIQRMGLDILVARFYLSRPATAEQIADLERTVAAFYTRKEQRVLVAHVRPLQRR